MGFFASKPSMISVPALPNMLLKTTCRRMLTLFSILCARFLFCVCACTYFVRSRVRSRSSRKCFGGT
jgi:hypothetical protein